MVLDPNLRASRFGSLAEAAAYLGALIDGEGCVFLGRSGRQISITNTDYDIIGAALDACQAIGVAPRVYLREKNWKGRLPLWKVQLMHHADFIRVSEVVPIFASRKVAALRAILASYKYGPQKRRGPRRAV